MSININRCKKFLFLSVYACSCVHLFGVFLFAVGMAFSVVGGCVRVLCACGVGEDIDRSVLNDFFGERALAMETRFVLIVLTFTY